MPLAQEQVPALQIWAEGADKAKGKSRFELQLADEFAIYTTPPSPTELRLVGCFDETFARTVSWYRAYHGETRGDALRALTVEQIREYMES